MSKYCKMLLFLPQFNLMTEGKVIQMAVLGDIKSFEMTFKQYYQPLVYYSHTILKDMDEAEDIVQQSFVTIWQKQSELKIETSLKSYLYKTVYNASLNRVKQQKVRQSYANEFQAISSHPVVENQNHKDLEQKIDWALTQLPEQCARVFKLSRYEQKKYQEIASELNISIKTVENHMGKALKLMREMLKDYLPLLIIFLLTNIGR
jgi:RNA polymerase sigma-70 factor, ECF subfamily